MPTLPLVTRIPKEVLERGEAWDSLDLEHGLTLYLSCTFLVLEHSALCGSLVSCDQLHLGM
jgi:hypothetical protein